MTNERFVFEINMEDRSPLSIEHVTPKKYTIFQWFRRIFTLDKVSNQKNHYPIFIVIMSILQILIFLLTYTDPSASDSSFIGSLYRIGRLFLPCMRPAKHDVRMHKVYCQQFINADMCYYDDVVKQDCFIFAYPHQQWRLVTVAFFHSNWFHLISNLSAQLLQGIPIERKYGTIYILVIYWLSGLIASLVSVIRLDSKAAVGASGCLHGIMLFLIMDRLSALKTNDGNNRTFTIVQLLFLVSPYILTTVVLTILYNVLHDAHIGGALVGILLATHALGFPLFCCCQDDAVVRTACRWLAVVLLILYFIVAVVIFLRSDAPIIYRIYHNYLRVNDSITVAYFE